MLQVPWKTFRIHIFTLSSSICFSKFRRNLIIPSISPRGCLDHWSCWCEQECLRICALVGVKWWGNSLGQVVKFLFQKKMSSIEVQNSQGKSMQITDLLRNHWGRLTGCQQRSNFDPFFCLKAMGQWGKTLTFLFFLTEFRQVCVSLDRSWGATLYM